MTTATRTRRPVKSADERDAEVAALKATLDAAVERIANSPEQWVEFLDVVSQFAARYSWGNQLLLLVQCQERGFTPTMVRPYGSRDKGTGKPRAGWAGGWLVLGRNVTQGQKSLKIWRPQMRRMTEAEVTASARPVRRDEKGRPPRRLVGFRIANVFDISQTEGDPVEIPEPIKVVRKVRAPGGAVPQLLTGGAPDALDEIVKMIKTEGYTFALAPKVELFGANGVTRSMTREVLVRDDVDPAQQLKTAIHELAHILCGHVAPDFAYHQHRGQAETEAESVAYVVSGALGLDSEKYSAPYVATWSEGDMAKVAKSAELIVKTARAILAKFDVEDEDEEDDQ